jgi:hypothetical protein
VELKLKYNTIYTAVMLLGIALLPFTRLRLGFLGLGELIFFGAFIYEYARYKDLANTPVYVFTKFWILFILVTLVGAIYHVFILRMEFGTYNTLWFDSVSYVMVLFGCFAFESQIMRGLFDVNDFIVKVFYSLGGVLCFLYIYSFFSPSFLGFPIKYYTYFAPLVKNIHQTSMVIVPLPFLGLYVWKIVRGFWLRLLTLVMVILTIAMALSTGSDKAIMGIYIGFGLSIIFWIYNIPKQRVNRQFFSSIAVFALLFVGAVLYFQLEDFLSAYFVEIDGGGARAYLYATSIGIGSHSPIVGFGPGAHIYGAHAKFWDAHQTFITAFLQGGLIGFLLFMGLIIKIGWSKINVPFLLGSFSPILIYATGGDILRRLPIWIILMLIYYCNGQNKNQIIEKK